MSSTWITAWIISALCYMAAFRAFRQSGLSQFDALALAVPFFPSPLTIAIGGSNSFLYLIDVAAPLLCLLAWGRLYQTDRWPKRFAVAFAIGAGLVPLVVTLLFAQDRNRLLFAAINCYRVIAGAALLIIGSAATVVWGKRDAFRDGRVLVGFSIACMVLAAALVLQYAGLINGNVFYGWRDSGSSPRDLTGFAVAGLFRGSLGIIGLSGVCAFLATRGHRGMLELTMVLGAVAGFAIIVIVGSKTSLALAVVLVMLGVLKAIRSGGRKIVYAMIFLAILGGVGYRYLNRLPAKYVQFVFGTLRGEEASLQTFDARQMRWEQAMDTLARSPEILFGLGLEKGGNIHLGYYHNEYVALLMNGGILSLGLYALLLLGLGWHLWRSLRIDRPIVVFGTMMFFCGLGQAVTVVHLMPGLFYAAVSGIFAVLYGLSLNPAACEEPEMLPIDDDLCAIPEHTF